MRVRVRVRVRRGRSYPHEVQLGSGLVELGLVECLV